MSSRPTPRFTPGRSSFLAAVIVGAVVLLVCLFWLPRLERRLTPLTGDEPFYVMTSISLIDDHDLDETNNYAQRDYDRFYPAFGPTADGWPAYPDPLPPHRSDTTRPGLYSKHGLGLALLIALPYHLGGRTLTLVVLATIAALLAAQMTLLATPFARSPALAATAALALALTNPLLSFSLLIFPEMTAALGITYATRRLFAPANRPWQWLLLGCAVAALPWLHYRLAVVSIALALAAVVRFRRQWTARDAVAALIVPSISAALLLWWNLRLYDRPLPPGSDHAGFSNLTGTLNGLAGTFFDQQWGAVIHNPLLLLALSTAIPFARENRRAALSLALITIPYLVLIASYRVWWGEWNPPARYLTDIVPLAVVPLAWLLGRLSTIARWLLFGIAGFPAVAVIVTFLTDPQRMYNQPDGTSRLLEIWRDWSGSLGFDATSAIPSYVFYSESPAQDRLLFGLLGLAWVGALTMVVSLLIRRESASDDSKTT